MRRPPRSILTVLTIPSLSLALSAAPARAAVQSVPVSYEAGGAHLKGHLFYDDAVKGKRPGVIVVHEWWGLNDYAKQRARMLAEAGYVALAADMYGDGQTTEHPAEAGQFAMAVSKDPAGAKARFEAGLDVLKKDPHTDAARLAAIGYCFGGGVVLNMARQGLDLKGVVSFHGSLNPIEPAKPGAVKARLLICHGAADPMVTHDIVEAFLKEMDAAGADYVFMSFAKAKHSFTNPGADAHGLEGLAYNAEADRLSWKAMLDFFVDIFH
jgi:dienelactone hydrolase